MWGQLGFGRLLMAVLDEEVFNVVVHGEATLTVDVFGGVVPGKVDARELFPSQSSEIL